MHLYSSCLHKPIFFSLLTLYLFFSITTCKSTPMVSEEESEESIFISRHPFFPEIDPNIYGSFEEGILSTSSTQLNLSFIEQEAPPVSRLISPRGTEITGSQLDAIGSHVLPDSQEHDIYKKALKALLPYDLRNGLDQTSFDFLYFLSKLPKNDILPFIGMHSELTSPCIDDDEYTPISHLTDFLTQMPLTYEMDVAKKLFALIYFMKEVPQTSIIPTAFYDPLTTEMRKYYIFDRIVGGVKTNWIPCTEDKPASWRNLRKAMGRFSVIYGDPMCLLEWNHGLDLLDQVLVKIQKNRGDFIESLRAFPLKRLCLRLLNANSIAAIHHEIFFRFMDYICDYGFIGPYEGSEEEQNELFEYIFTMMSIWFNPVTDIYHQYPDDDISQNWLLRALHMIRPEDFTSTASAFIRAIEMGIILAPESILFRATASLPEDLRSELLPMLNILVQNTDFSYRLREFLFDFTPLWRVPESQQIRVFEAYVMSFVPTLLDMQEKRILTWDFQEFTNDQAISPMKYVTLFPENQDKEAGKELARMCNIGHLLDLKPVFKTLKRLPPDIRLRTLSQALDMAYNNSLGFVLCFYAEIYFSDFPDIKIKVIEHLKNELMIETEEKCWHMIDYFLHSESSAEKEKVISSWERRATRFPEPDYSVVQMILDHSEYFKKNNRGTLLKTAQSLDSSRLLAIIQSDNLHKSVKAARIVQNNTERWDILSHENHLYAAAVHKIVGEKPLRSSKPYCAQDKNSL